MNSKTRKLRHKGGFVSSRPFVYKWLGGRVKYIGSKSEIALARYGFATLDSLRAAPDDELLAIPGIGPGRLAKIRAELARLAREALVPHFT